MVHTGACVVLLVLVDSSLSLVNNSMIEARNALEDLKESKISDVTGVRRAYKSPPKAGKSTSSESKDDSGVGKDVSSDGESLGLTFSESTEEKEKKKEKQNKRIPVSSNERRGWRKWHRKCPSCPEDMKMKWRDPEIKWICGAFQRARRSFKSLCMMHYRNCQDGTMFVKIHDHRCANSTAGRPTGDHFFYDYRVLLPLESGSRSTSEEEKISSE